MKTETFSFSKHAHLAIMAATLVISAAGWSQYLPQANRTYALSWADYSPLNSGNALQTPERLEPRNQVALAMADLSYMP